MQNQTLKEKLQQN